MSRKVVPCPEDCERSWPVHGCAEILVPPTPDGSCWKCDGLGFVSHDGDPSAPTVILRPAQLHGETE